MYKLDNENNLRFIPSGNESDLDKSPIFLPLGFDIDDSLVSVIKDSLNQLYVTHQKQFDMTTVARHLNVALTRYINGK